MSIAEKKIVFGAELMSRAWLKWPHEVAKPVLHTASRALLMSCAAGNNAKSPRRGWIDGQDAHGGRDDGLRNDRPCRIGVRRAARTFIVSGGSGRAVSDRLEPRSPRHRQSQLE